MYGSNTNMYANMMGQHAGGMVGQQMGVGQMGTQLGGQMAGQTVQPMGQMQSQLGGQMPQLLTQAGQQQGALQQPTPGTGMMTALPGMAGMAGMGGMSGMNISGLAGINQAGGATATPTTAAPGMMGQQGTGMMGQQGTGMLSQQGTGMMGQQGMNPGMSNWQTMAAGNPQAMAAMQAYMQQYAMRMAAYQRMAAAASAGGMSNPGGMGAMGGMGPMGAMGSMGPMGAMGGMAGPMGAMGGMAPGVMGMMGAQMHQQHHMRSSQQQSSQDGENSRFWKTRICNKWKEGHCPYGPTCKYAHGDSDLRPPVPEGGKGGARGPKVEAVDKRTMIELMKKTRICEEFVRTGSCKYGDKCTFAHGQNELRQAPSTLTTTQQQQASKEGSKDGSLHKTRLCERFMNTNSCPYGDKCTFAHGHHELRSKGAAGVAGGNRNQGQQQKQRKAQQKGEGGGGSAVLIAGSKRERDETGSGGAAGEGGEAGDKSTDVGESAKRQHVGAAEGEGGEWQKQGMQGEEDPSQQQERAGDGEDRWKWGSSPSPNRDGGEAGDDTEMAEQQQRRGGDQRDDDEEGGRNADGDVGLLPGGDLEMGSPNGALEAAGGDGTAGDGVDDDGAAAGHIGGDDAAAAAAGTSEPECRLCASMVKMGRDKMLAAVQQLGSPAAQKLGAMILGYGTPRFEQLWHKLSFGQLQSMLSKSELSVADRIELLKAVSFHTHASEEEREKLESQKYVSQGLPPVVADFVAMVLEGKEGSTQMAEYFAALEVCKTLYGVTEDEYFNVSSTMANLFMNM